MLSSLIEKYIWLLQELTDAGEEGMSLDEIVKEYQERYDSAYPRRTFNNHRASIEEVFGIKIGCDRSTNRYFIDEYAIDKRQTVQWLINTFSVNSLLSLGKERLGGRVLVEDVPSGHRFLTKVMTAMMENKVISITYCKYSSSTPEVLNIHPYAVKEYEKRWYLIGYCVERKALRLYGLDRIRSIKETGDTFVYPKDFNAREKFVVSFGPYLPEGKPQIIRLKAYGTEALYLKDLPLHESQTLVSSDDEGSIFRLYLIPTENFVMELCKLGSRIEVLEPVSLRNRVVDELTKTLDIYR